MAKVSKSVKQKRKDFAKTKLKVGKQKAQANNYTDTSFKAAKIVLPKQSVNNAVHMGAQEDGTEYSTDGGKFLEDSIKDRAVLDKLLGLLHHKAHETRKDALVSLASFLTAKHKHQSISSILLTPVMAKLIPMILDDDRIVRRQLLATFEKFQALARQAHQQPGRHGNFGTQEGDPKEENVLVRYSDDFLLYITSAMTHIVASIRADSTKFLALLLDSDLGDADVLAEDAQRPTSQVLQRLVSGADASSGARSQGGASLSKLIDCFALLLGISGSDAKGAGMAVTARVATTTGIKTTIQHLQVLAVVLDAALKPQNTALRIAPTFRCMAEGPLLQVVEGKPDSTVSAGPLIFATRVFNIYEPSSLNLFAPGSALGQTATDETESEEEEGEQSAARLIILRHAAGFIKHLTDLFADGVNMHLELCVPCLHVLTALSPLLYVSETARSDQVSKKQRDLAKLVAKMETKLKNGLDQLADRGGPGVVKVAKAYEGLLIALQQPEAMGE